MPSNVIAAGILDISRSDPGFRDYAALTPKEKIDLIVKKIKQFAEKMQKEFPNDAHLVVLREYAIFNAVPKESKLDIDDFHHFSVSLADKEYLEQEMLKLMVKYENLNIIPGSTPDGRQQSEVETKLVESLKGKNCTKREIALAILLKQKEYYSHHPVEDKEAQQKIISHEKRIYELAKILAVEDELKACKSDEEAEKIIKKILHVSNTANIFHRAGDPREPYINITKSRKMTPYNESGYTKEYRYRLFRPGSRFTSKRDFELLHPSGKKISTRLRICLESYLLDAGKPTNKPDLEIIISDSIQVFPSDLDRRGINIVQADSEFAPRLIKTGDGDVEVKLFSLNVLDAKAEVRGPLKAYYPLEWVILKKIEILISEFKAAIKLIDDLIHKWVQQKRNRDENANTDLKKNFEEVKEDNVVFDQFRKSINWSTDDLTKYFESHQDKLMAENRQLQDWKTQVLAINPETEFTIGVTDLEGKIYRNISRAAEEKNAICIQDIAKNLKKEIDEFKADPHRQYLNTKKPAPVDEIKSVSEFKSLRA